MAARRAAIQWLLVRPMRRRGKLDRQIVSRLRQIGRRAQQIATGPRQIGRRVQLDKRVGQAAPSDLPPTERVEPPNGKLEEQIALTAGLRLELAAVAIAVFRTLQAPGTRALSQAAQVGRAGPLLVQAVREVLPAWGVHGGAAADDVDEECAGEINDMILTRPKVKLPLLFIGVVLVLVGVQFTSQFARSQQPSAPSSNAAAQKSFATPQQAVDALIKAAGSYDVPSLLEIFGPDGEDFISSADPVRDKTNSVEFATLAREKNSVEINPSRPNRATLIVGDENWPFPVPIVKKSGKWIFDSKAGRTEILDRRIGANELDAIQVCRGFVDAQHEYSLAMHDGVNQYAQRIISSPGKQDGLYWEDRDGRPAGPISKPIAQAIEEGYSTDQRSAYHGYYFKVLKGQGPAAPMGRLDYVIQGVMIGGFALIAAPAEYRVTGVKTFMVNQDGIVYQKDLGPDTLNIAKKIDLYNPDKTWQRTNDHWPTVASSIATETNFRKTD